MIRYFRVLWRNIHHREELNEDLDAELGAYFDAIVADKIRSGASSRRRFPRSPSGTGRHGTGEANRS